MSRELSDPQLVLPAAALRLWGDDASEQKLVRESEREPGLVQLSEGFWAVLPTAGLPGVFDRAVAIGSRLVPGAKGETSGTQRSLVALIEVRCGAAFEPVESELLPLLGGDAPALPGGTVCATAHAVRGLESACSVDPVGGLKLRSGRRLPVFGVRRTAPPRDAVAARRDEQLGGRRQWFERPRLEQELDAALRTGGPVRVTGPLGAGKSRLVEQVLRATGRASSWHDVASDRDPILNPPSATGADAAGPWLVIDSLQAGGSALWERIAQLARGKSGAAANVVLIGREPLPWPNELKGAATVEVPFGDAGLAAEAMRRSYDRLDLPAPLAALLLERCGGNLFLLEEEMVALARGRQLRQVLGSFFYGGKGEAAVQPSPRVVLQLESEMRRLGGVVLARLACLLEQPIPAVELAATVAGGEGALASSAGWEIPYLRSGLMNLRSGPFGEGVVWAAPALAAAGRATMADASRDLLGRRLGARLAARAQGASAHWSAYSLLAGSAAGARLLLAAAAGPGGPGREELLAALVHELEAARHAKPRDPELELDLLWALLPLGRRLGKLHELKPLIDRAVLLAEDRPGRLLPFAAIQAELARNAGRLQEAETVLRRALAATQATDDRRRGPLLLELARIVALRGSPDSARSLLERMLAAAENQGRSGLVASCEFQLGNLALAAYRLDEARSHYERALEIRRRAAPQAAVIQALAALGTVEYHGGNYPGALERYREATGIAVRHGFEREESYGQLGIGRVLAQLGDALGASDALRRALSLREGRDDRLGEAIARLAVAANHLSLERVELALGEARRAHFELNLLPEGEARADAECLLGRIALRKRQLAPAAEHLAEAARLHRAAGHGQSLLADLGLLLQTALAAGEIGGVVSAFDALDAERSAWSHVPSGERSDFDLFRGARWLAERRVRDQDPLPYLERAYRELLRKTAFLDPPLRQRYLFQIPEHQAILDAATAAGLVTSAS